MVEIPEHVSAARLAGMVQLTERRIRQLAAEEGLPRSSRDQYPLAPAVQWFVRYWESRSAMTPINEGRRRRLEAEAKLSEIDLARRRSQLASVAMIEAVQAERVARIRKRVMQIPVSAVSMLRRSARTPALTKAIIEAECYRALQELSAAKR